MLQAHIVFFAAMALFVATMVRLVVKRTVFSPQFFAATTFVVMGVMALFPQMIFSPEREYSIALGTQIFIFIGAVIFFGATWFMRRPRIRSEYPPIRWKFLPRLAWLFVFLGFCVADPVVSYLLYGKVGLVQGNQGMGTGGGGHSDVFTPLTFIAWSCACMAMSMLLTDFLYSFETFGSYLRRRFVDVSIVLLCSACTALSGNRFVLICQLLSLLIGLALFGRLRVWAMAAVAVFLGFFFVIVGNFRFGQLNVVDKLQHTTGIDAFDMLRAWVVTYSEPTYPNLDNFLRDPPPLAWGQGWFTSVIPSGISTAMGLSRVNSSQWFDDNNLYAYHGLTFRTLFPDLVMDFGTAGALIITLVFLAIGVRIYNRSLQSQFNTLLFLAYSPLILSMPLWAGFYSLPNLVTFCILLLAPRPPKVRRIVQRPVGKRGALKLRKVEEETNVDLPTPATLAEGHS